MENDDVVQSATPKQAATPTLAEKLPDLVNLIDIWWNDSRQHLAGLDTAVYNRMFEATEDLKKKVRSLVK